MHIICNPLFNTFLKQQINLESLKIRNNLVNRYKKICFFFVTHFKFLIDTTKYTSFYNFKQKKIQILLQMFNQIQNFCINLNMSKLIYKLLKHINFSQT